MILIGGGTLVVLLFLYLRSRSSNGASADTTGTTQDAGSTDGGYADLAGQQQADEAQEASDVGGLSQQEASDVSNLQGEIGTNETAISGLTSQQLADEQQEGSDVNTLQGEVNTDEGTISAQGATITSMGKRASAQGAVIRNLTKDLKSEQRKIAEIQKGMRRDTHSAKVHHPKAHPTHKPHQSVHHNGGAVAGRSHSKPTVHHSTKPKPRPAPKPHPAPQHHRGKR